MNGKYVIDMDSHVLEPPDLRENYLESKYQERGIFVRNNVSGVEELIVDNEGVLSGRLASPGGVHHNPGELFLQPESPCLEGCPPASYDTAASIEDSLEQLRPENNSGSSNSLRFRVLWFSDRMLRNNVFTQLAVGRKAARRPMNSIGLSTT